MSEIVVIQAADGVYHLCYAFPNHSTYYSFQTFENKDLADTTAWRMNQERNQKG